MQLNKFSIGAMAFLVISAAQQVAVADNPPELRTYSIKQSVAPVGTNFKRDIVKAGNIPLDKSYDQLTDAQKELLRGRYDNMPAGDEPPFPEKGLMSIYRAIGTAHEKSEYANVGPFSMEVSVDAEGHPKSVRILNSPGDDITTAATYAAMHKLYKPAVCGGKPCAMAFPIEAELLAPDVSVMKSFNTPGVQLTK